MKESRGIVQRFVACLVGAALAFLGAVSIERAIAAWAARLVRTGPPHVKRFGAAKLERLGGSGVVALLELARDRTVVPLPRELAGAPPVPGRLIPHDTVGDIALDALRRLRTGRREAARVFEWCTGSGVSYEEAYEAWRQAEIQEALEWWRRAKMEAAP